MLALRPAGALWVDVAAFELAAGPRVARRDRADVPGGARPATPATCCRRTPTRTGPPGRRERTARDLPRAAAGPGRPCTRRAGWTRGDRGARSAWWRATPAHEAAHLGLMRLYALRRAGGDGRCGSGRAGAGALERDLDAAARRGQPGRSIAGILARASAAALPRFTAAPRRTIGGRRPPPLPAGIRPASGASAMAAVAGARRRAC